MTVGYNPELGPPKSRKRKRTATSAQSLLTALPVQQSPGNSVPLQQKQKSAADDILNQSQKAGKKHKKLRARLERERAADIKAQEKQMAPSGDPSSIINNQHLQNQARHTSLQGENALSSKRSKNSKNATLESQTEHLSSSSPVLNPLIAKHAVLSTSTPEASQSQSQPHHTPIPHIILHSTPQYLGHDVPSLTSLPSAPQASFIDPSLILTDMQIQAQHGVEFDPFLPWLYMLPGTLLTPMPIAPMFITPMSLSVPSTDQLTTHPGPVLPKTSSKPKSKAPKVNQKPTLSKLPHSQAVLEKPFTIRALPRGTEGWAQSVSYLPIGKPDLHFKHGIFPIIPSIMLPSGSSESASSSTMRQNSFKPDILSTLVLENLPKASCNVSWVKKWCLSASGVQPKHVLMAPRRALIEFQRSGDAISAWASRKSGVDKVSNHASQGENGDLSSMLAYWYRQDLEQERGLLELWRHSKKMLPEFIGVAVVKDGNVVLRAIEEALEVICAKLRSKEREVDEAEDIIVFNGMDVDSVKQNWLAPDVKSEFRNLAEQMAFWQKYDMAGKDGMTEDQLLIWEQQEIARVDRVRSIAYAKQKGGNTPRMRKRTLEEDIEGRLKEDDLRKKRARKTVSEDVVKRPSAPVTAASTTTVRLDPYVRTSILSARQAAQEVKSVAPVSSCKAAGPTGRLTLLSPLAKLKESSPSSRNTQISSSMPSKVHDGPITMQNVPSASVTSSMVKKFCDFGLSLTIPSLASSMSEDRSTTSPASLSIPSSSFSALPTRRNSKKQPQEDFIAESIQVSSPPVPPVHRFPSILVAVENKEDVVKTGAPESSSSSGVTRALPFVVKVKEDQRIVRASESTQIVENIQVVQERTLRDSNEAGIVGHSNAIVTSFPRGNSKEISQDHSSPVSTALNTSFKESVSNAHANPEPHTKPNPALPKSFSVSEPAISEVSPFQSLNDKKDTSDDMEILPVSEKIANVPLSTSVIEAVVLPRIAINQESQSQQVIARTVPSIVLPSNQVSSTISISLSSKALIELTRMLTKSKEERQAFLDRELKATKVLMDQLMVTTCKEQKKGITSLWKEKIRCASFLIRLIVLVAEVPVSSSCW